MKPQHDLLTPSDAPATALAAGSRPLVMAAMAGLLSLGLAAGCGDDGSEDGTPSNPDAASTGGNPDSGASSPDASTPVAPRVRRSWNSLSPEERKQYIDGVILLKQKTQLTWDYASACEGRAGAYTKNGYDYFVELHLAAFDGMHIPGAFDPYNRPHMGPQFLPWHREYLLRYENELREVLNDPDFTLPYWDWSDPADQVFSTEDLGDLGACPTGPESGFGEVSGYIADQGYQINVRDTRGMDMMVTLECAPSRLTRGSACFPDIVSALPTDEDVTAALAIPTYDTAPYDTLTTDEQVSFRQNIEGYTNEDEPGGFCAMAGCRTHGAGHVWIGGNLGSGAAPNDPLFFLHHANVDRIWAEWQDRYGDDTYPEEYKGDMFSLTKDDGTPAKASETFDHRGLGYIYDTQAAN